MMEKKSGSHDNQENVFDWTNGKTFATSETCHGSPTKYFSGLDSESHAVLGHIPDYHAVWDILIIHEINYAKKKKLYKIFNIFCL
jgi:hypothetical protein